MKRLSTIEKGDVSFSRRFTIHQIWAILDKKYPGIPNQTNGKRTA